MIIKKSILLYLCFSISMLSFSQSIDSVFIQDYRIQESEIRNLYFQIDNNNFVKNNEYFGPIAEGYTLLGFNFAPRIAYYPSPKVKLSAGGNFLSYYGRENEVEARLLLTFQYKAHPNLDFVLGNIYGTANHRMIGPLFDFERHLNKNIENGIQFLWNSKRIYADLWLDWEQQILEGDPFQEMFNVGLSTNFLIVNKANYKVSIPFQNLVRHEGGQINSNSGEPLTTIFNNATGIVFSKPLNTRLVDNMDISTYVVNYQDLSPQKLQMYIDGIASYSTINLTNKKIGLMFGYWYGEQYVAPIGNPLFESYSRTKFYVEEPIRQLALTKLCYREEIIKNLNLVLRFEGYYDIPNGNTEYTWAIIVTFNEKFFLKKY